MIALSHKRLRAVEVPQRPVINRKRLVKPNLDAKLGE